VAVIAAQALAVVCVPRADVLILGGRKYNVTVAVIPGRQSAKLGVRRMAESALSSRGVGSYLI
jgi:hypothetical protein